MQRLGNSKKTIRESHTVRAATPRLHLALDLSQEEFTQSHSNQRKHTGCFAVYVIILVTILCNSRTKNDGILQCFIIFKTCVHIKEIICVVLREDQISKCIQRKKNKTNVKVHEDIRLALKQYRESTPVLVRPKLTLVTVRGYLEYTPCCTLFLPFLPFAFSLALSFFLRIFVLKSKLNWFLTQYYAEIYFLKTKNVGNRTAILSRPEVA